MSSSDLLIKFITIILFYLFNSFIFIYGNIIANEKLHRFSFYPDKNHLLITDFGKETKSTTTSGKLKSSIGNLKVEQNEKFIHEYLKLNYWYQINPKNYFGMTIPYHFNIKREVAVYLLDNPLSGSELEKSGLDHFQLNWWLKLNSSLEVSRHLEFNINSHSGNRIWSINQKKSSGYYEPNFAKILYRHGKFINHQEFYHEFSFKRNFATIDMNSNQAEETIFSHDQINYHFLFADGNPELLMYQFHLGLSYQGSYKKEGDLTGLTAGEHQYLSNHSYYWGLGMGSYLSSENWISLSASFVSAPRSLIESEYYSTLTKKLNDQSQIEATWKTTF